MRFVYLPITLILVAGMQVIAAPVTSSLVPAAGGAEMLYRRGPPGPPPASVPQRSNSAPPSTSNHPTPQRQNSIQGKVEKLTLEGIKSKDDIRWLLLYARKIIFGKDADPVFFQIGYDVKVIVPNNLDEENKIKEIVNRLPGKTGNLGISGSPNVQVKSFVVNWGEKERVYSSRKEFTMLPTIKSIVLEYVKVTE